MTASRHDTWVMIAAYNGGAVIGDVVDVGQGAALQTGIDFALRRGAGHIDTEHSMARGQGGFQAVPILFDYFFRAS